jgi:hypothetical protein
MIHTRTYTEAAETYKDFVGKETEEWRSLYHKAKHLGGNINNDNNNKNNILFTYNKNAYNC